ncbi:MAG: hypothetical protein EP311_04115 [Cytophagales bacterium]|nr:MAG: hypothetical protein EP311_04115 [Cytophagales bacterium]
MLWVVLVLTSCRETDRLSEEEHKWMPYKGNEILVFSSNTGDTDTIFFLEKDTVIAYPEAQEVNGKTYEVVTIICRHTDPLQDGGYRYLENDFVELQKSKDKKARLHFNLSTKDANFYQLTGIIIDSLAQQKFTSLTTKQKSYSDVYIIDGEDWLNFKQRSDYVKKLYWSKSEGLVRYDKQDSVYWELTKKYSP